MNCPFCDPKIQDAIFAESENFLALYNIAPIFPGHSLIIPKQHIESIQEITDEQLCEMMLFARKVTNLLLKVFEGEAFNWSVQDKEAAGQTLAHLHLHIVLRYPGDLPDPGNWYPKVQQNYGEILDSASRDRLGDEEMRRIVDVLRKKGLSSR